ncbi:MAG: thymidylate synthase [Candidatus Omnitrophota bacterium]|nr:thymidylate synthase [Candidatus Omnitrophota bacterium]MDZ4243461.1 thymidylate synthase [Candidatus Omnitrophota bacterium]
MKPYLDLVRHILDHGERKEDRTGTGTISVFGYQSRYDLQHGFPILTTKKILFPAVVRELLWFLRGSTNINDGLAQHTPIWNAWADPRGELGPVYGYQWRRWERFVKDEGADFYRKTHIDQITDVIKMIKSNPNSRRLIVSAWNVADIERMALPPCHLLFQFYVVSGRLDCQLYQRSADVALGVPFNISSYALLLSMVAQECGLTPGVFVHTLGDAHIYLNHVDGLRVQLERAVKPLPQLKMVSRPVLEMAFEDIELLNYQHHDFIKFPIAV